jgi:hypothetical protein
MVRKRYTGLSNPRAELEAFRPAHQLAIKLMQNYFPFSPEYCALMAISDAIRQAGCRLVPDEPYLFGGEPPGQGRG